METKELKITPPEGYEIDKENSTLDHIKFKPIKKLTYSDIAKKLFRNKKSFLADSSVSCYPHGPNNINLATLCTSEKQAKKLLAINKLMNVAKYLNGDWKPNWLDDDEYKYCIYYWTAKDQLAIDHNTSNCHCTVYFKEIEFARKAIEILGKDTVKLAVSTDW